MRRHSTRWHCQVPLHFARMPRTWIERVGVCTPQVAAMRAAGAAQNQAVLSAFKATANLAKGYGGCGCGCVGECGGVGECLCVSVWRGWGGGGCPMTAGLCICIVRTCCTCPRNACARFRERLFICVCFCCAAFSCLGCAMSFMLEGHAIEWKLMPAGRCRDGKRAVHLLLFLLHRPLLLSPSQSHCSVCCPSALSECAALPPLNACPVVLG